MDIVAPDRQNSRTHTAGALRARLSDTLSDAYGRGLLSEHTLATRLESLLGDPVIDPRVLVGDLCLRRPEDTLWGRLAQTMSTVFDRSRARFP